MNKEKKLPATLLCYCFLPLGRKCKIILLLAEGLQKQHSEPSSHFIYLLKHLIRRGK